MKIRKWFFFLKRKIITLQDHSNIELHVHNSFVYEANSIFPKNLKNIKIQIFLPFQSKSNSIIFFENIYPIWFLIHHVEVFELCNQMHTFCKYIRDHCIQSSCWLMWQKLHWHHSLCPNVFANSENKIQKLVTVRVYWNLIGYPINH